MPAQPQLTQRWRTRRDSYRPAGEPIVTSLYEVAPIANDGPAKDFVLQHHYSRAYPAARFRFGLYRRQALVGVAVFSHPCSDRVLTSVFPVPATDAVELGRFVLLDEVPANGETFFLARCFSRLRADVAGVVSFSDPIPWPANDGRIVFPGHIGTIYQAFNGTYVGRSSARTIRLLPDGRVFSARAAQKIRAGDRGWRYSAQILIDAGAEPPAQHELPSAWLRHWLPRLTRTLRHPGNHRYAWPLDRALRNKLPAPQRYPKRSAAPIDIHNSHDRGDPS